MNDQSYTTEHSAHGKSNDGPKSSKASVTIHAENRAFYQTLLNEGLANDPGLAGQFEASYVGASHWSSTEKERFFNALPTLGRLEVAKIAAAIDTKSEFEVAFYINAMQATCKRHGNIVDLRAIPSAIEIRPELDDRLTDYGLHLAMYQQKQNSYHEKTFKYVEPALPQWDHDNSFETRELQTREDELLNVNSLLNASERGLQTARHKNESGSVDEFLNEKPSISHSAVVELHKLVVNVTARLVQTAIASALSRSGQESAPMNPVIEPQDVTAAREVEDFCSINSAAQRIGTASRTINQQATNQASIASGTGSLPIILPLSPSASQEAFHSTRLSQDIDEDQMSSDGEQSRLIEEFDEKQTSSEEGRIYCHLFSPQCHTPEPCQELDDNLAATIFNDSNDDWTEWVDQASRWEMDYTDKAFEL